MIRNWQEEMENNVTTMEEIKDKLNTDVEEFNVLKELTQRFPMSIPRYYLSLIDWEDPEDPIRRMCIPSPEEASMAGVFDTSGEASNTVIPGLQHKYSETALILSSYRCAMYCRHCFRRRMVGLNDEEISANIARQADYVSAHPEINNVLLTGGDFLMNSNEKIAEYLEAFADLKQLDFIRLGTRIPVVFPHRIIHDPELLDILNHYNTKKQLYLITHFNHPRECTAKAAEAIRAIREIGIPVKNQSVLLKGVNDDGRVLGDLLRRLTTMGIVGHYIFQCRPVRGVSAHCQVPILRGIEIVKEANAMQNGLGKSADYTMSHVRGKIEILGNDPEGNTLFRYHQARDINDLGRIFPLKLKEDQSWLPE